MASKLLFCVLFGLLCISFPDFSESLIPYSDVCAVNIYGNTYDLSGLKGVEMRLSENALWSVYLNLCGVTHATPECAAKNAMLCAVKMTTNETYAIVNPFPKSYFVWSEISNGVTLTAYGQPEECPFGNMPPSFRITVLCNPYQVRTPSIISVSTNTQSCTYSAVIYHAQGCALNYATPPRQPIYYNTADGKTVPLNVAIGLGCALGSVMLIVVIVLIVYSCRRGYCRCCCNCKRGESSMKQGLLDFEQGLGDGVYGRALPYAAPASLGVNAPGALASAINI